MLSNDIRISELLTDVPDDDLRKAELLKKHNDFWEAYKNKLKLEAD